MDNKKKVIPNEDRIAKAKEAYSSNKSSGVSTEELSAIEQMEARTMQQLLEKGKKVKDDDTPISQLNSETEEVSEEKETIEDEVKEEKVNEKKEIDYGKISQPQMDDEYDLVPLPSKGRFYKNGKEKVKVAFLNTMDENIMTNESIISSGDFLEIIINRKLLEPNLRYKDLTIGDRNAIMIWLRSTSFGSDYTVEMINPNDYSEKFQTTFDLDELKINYLNLETDEDGFMDYTFPLSKKNVKFRFLTIQDVLDIEEHVQETIKTKGEEYADGVSYTIFKHIVSIEGETDKDYIYKFSRKLRSMDSRKFLKFISENEPDIDLNVSVKTPGGESINTFLPLGQEFFWPEL